MAQTEAVTVRKQIVVGTPIERAVTVFTDRFGAFQARGTTCSGHRSPRRCSGPGSAGTSWTGQRPPASAGGRGS